MKQLLLSPSRLSLLLGLTWVFQWLFWSEGLGLNLLLFGLLATLAMLSLHPDSWRSISVRLVAAGTLLSAGMVIWHHTGTALVVYFLSMLLLAGLIQAPHLRSAAHAMGQGLGSYLTLGISFKREVRRLAVEIDWLQRLWPYLRLMGLPLLGLGVFAAIFLTANPRLAELSENAVNELSLWLSEVSFAWLGFTLLGLIVVAGLIYPQPQRMVWEHEGKQSDQLIRQRRKQGTFDFLGLKKEYRSGVLMLAMINALLFVNNLVDVSWIWLGRNLPQGLALTQFVHEGTYLLIISILLAMGIMLYYFRGNQNFYRSSSLLRALSYLWIAQNVILVISVALRNYHYIDHFGLAYKRIGVFFFLGLVLFGLGSLVLKIRERRSVFFLFRLNGWAVYGLALMLTLVNWDRFIAQYNLNHYEQTGFLDRGFLLDLSEQALPMLLTRPEVFEQADDGRKEHYRFRLRENITRFERRQAQASWRAWNWADARVASFLEKHGSR